MQKFFKGDLVWVGDMPHSMKHFSNNCEAIVLETYSEMDGKITKMHDKEYTLYILGSDWSGESSWYEEDQLTLIEPNRLDCLPKTSIHRKIAEAKAARDITLSLTEEE